MHDDTWIGVDIYHNPYYIFISYCTMAVSIQMLSSIMVNTINYYDMNDNFRRM